MESILINILLPICVIIIINIFSWNKSRNWTGGSKFFALTNLFMIDILCLVAVITRHRETILLAVVILVCLNILINIMVDINKKKKKQL